MTNNTAGRFSLKKKTKIRHKSVQEPKTGIIAKASPVIIASDNFEGDIPCLIKSVKGMINLRLINPSSDNSVQVQIVWT